MDATRTKPFNIDKKLVYDAYKAVKANAGAAGVDGQSLEQFDRPGSTLTGRAFTSKLVGTGPVIVANPEGA
jgi:hypothetical protein